MASINASTSGPGGIITSGDTSGNLSLQSGGTTVVALTSAGAAVTGTLSATGAANLSNTLTVTGAITATGGIVQGATAAPAFSARNSTNQSLTNNTSTKVALQTEEFDTNNNFDSTTNYRFTPTVAGYYQINGQVKIENNSNAGTLVCTIFKNGVDYKEAQNTVRSGSNTSAGVSSIVYFNGSTDYVELYVNQVTTTTATLIANGTIATWFNGAFVRSA